MTNTMTALWARTALLWFAVTVSVGLFMGIAQKFQFVPAHAHLGVLGWLSAGVYAFLTHVAREPRVGARGPMFHWLAHNVGVAVMTGGLAAAIATQNMGLEPVIAIGATIVVVSVYGALFMFWPRLEPRAD